MPPCYNSAICHTFKLFPSKVFLNKASTSAERLRQSYPSHALKKMSYVAYGIRRNTISPDGHRVCREHYATFCIAAWDCHRADNTVDYSPVSTIHTLDACRIRTTDKDAKTQTHPICNGVPPHLSVVEISQRCDLAIVTARFSR